MTVLMPLQCAFAPHKYTQPNTLVWRRARARDSIIVIWTICMPEKEGSARETLRSNEREARIHPIWYLYCWYGHCCLGGAYLRHPWLLYVRIQWLLALHFMLCFVSLLLMALSPCISSHASLWMCVCFFSLLIFFFYFFARPIQNFEFSIHYYWWWKNRKKQQEKKTNYIVKK